IYRQLGDNAGIADATAQVGVGAANRGNYALGQRLLEEALASGALREDRVTTARLLRELGIVSISAGEFARARTLLTESARISDDGSPWRALALTRVAIIDRLEGDYASARMRLADALEQQGPFNSPVSWDTIHRLEMANLARAEGRFDEARIGITAVLGRLR